MDANRRRTVTLVATILGSGIALLDSTIVNVALPAIEDDLGGGLAGQQWVVNAYLLTLGSLILLGGTLGDVYGPRRIFVIGVASFGVASVLCAVAPTIETLVAARAIQGATSALLTPASLALIAAIYDDEQERGAAIGTWAAWGGLADDRRPRRGRLARRRGELALDLRRQRATRGGRGRARADLGVPAARRWADGNGGSTSSARYSPRSVLPGPCTRSPCSPHAVGATRSSSSDSPAARSSSRASSSTNAARRTPCFPAACSRAGTSRSRTSRRCSSTPRSRRSSSS